MQVVAHFRDYQEFGYRALNFTRWEARDVELLQEMYEGSVELEFKLTPTPKEKS